MTKISAKVIADSKNEFGNRITTMIVTFPRFILAELNTHRMMSRNSASSRAIPFEKMVASVENDPFIPIAWQKDHKGMQGTEYFINERGASILHTQGNNNTFVGYMAVSNKDVNEKYYTLTKLELEKQWLVSRNQAVIAAKTLSSIGLTKQLCNRLLEPFMWHTVIITATEWENFFALRCPKYEYIDKGVSTTARSRKEWLEIRKDSIGEKPEIPTNTVEWLQLNKGQAEIHMMELAEQMWDAMNESTPKELKAGEWHIPFGDNMEGEIPESITDNLYKQNLLPHEAANLIKLKIATARCARVSYTVVGEEDKPTNYENDIKLHDRLAESGHWSPFEHCAQAMSHGQFDNSFHKGNEGDGPDFYTNGWSGNFRGFIQYRKTFKNENITK